MTVYLTNQRVNVGTHFDSGPQPYAGTGTVIVSVSADPVVPQNSTGAADIWVNADLSDGAGMQPKIHFPCWFGTITNPRTGVTGPVGSSSSQMVDTTGWLRVQVTCDTTGAPCLLGASTTP